MVLDVHIFGYTLAGKVAPMLIEQLQQQKRITSCHTLVEAEEN